MVLLHQIVQVLAGSNLDARRKFAVFFHLPHRTVRGSIGVQGDLRGHASVLHRATEQRFGGVHVPVPAEKEIHRLARFVDGAVQVHPLSVNLYIRLVHPPRSADGPSVAPPALFEFWKVALNPPQDRCMGHRDPSIRHHDHQIPQAQFEACVPAHAQNDNLSVEVASFEQIFDRDEPLHLFIIDRHPRVCTRAATTAPFNSNISFNNVSLPSIIPIVRGIPIPPACGPQVPEPCSTFAPRGVQANAQTPATLEWNFGIEQEITRSMALRVAYVGSHAYHNIVNTDLNSIPPQICASANGCASGGIGSARGTVPQGAQFIPVGNRPNPFLANGFFWSTYGNASYNSLQLELTRRLAQGLTFRGNYTRSKNLDMGSGLSNSLAINQSQQLLNRFDPRRDYGPSALDVSNRLSANASYELPFGKGKHWLGGLSGAADKFLGGWQLNTIVSLQSGFPLTPQVGSNRSRDGYVMNPDRPNRNPSFTGNVLLGKLNRWFDPTAFLFPTAGTYGNVGRGTLRGPALANTDISVFKTTPLLERFRLQFRAEFFNIFNRANFGIPN